MLTDGENRPYTAIKNMSRLLSKLNRKSNQVYLYCMNCLNGYLTASTRDKHYQYCSSNGHVKVKIASDKEKLIKFHDGQYQRKSPFMLYADFENMLKPVDEQYQLKMKKKSKVEGTEYRKDKPTCTVRMVCTLHV